MAVQARAAGEPMSWLHSLDASPFLAVASLVGVVVGTLVWIGLHVLAFALGSALSKRDREGDE